MPQQLVMFLVPSCSSTSPMMEKSLAPHALPPELWSYVLLKLWEGEASLQSLELAKTCVSALLAASGVCKAWYTLLERNWKSLFLSHFSEQDLKVNYAYPVLWSHLFASSRFASSCKRQHFGSKSLIEQRRYGLRSQIHCWRKARETMLDLKGMQG